MFNIISHAQLEALVRVLNLAQEVAKNFNARK